VCPGWAVVVDAHGMVEEVSEEACALLGYSRAELLGLHGSELVPREDHPATAASIDRMRRGELTIQTGRLRRKDGALIGVEVEGRPLQGGRLALGFRLGAGAPRGS
jgi:PAS domain S-box-containing protein